MRRQPGWERNSASHLSEELWERLGHKLTIVYESFPSFDPALLIEDTIEIPIQIMGKVRSKISVPAEADAKAIEEMALADAKVRSFLEGKQVRKVVVVPGRMVNIVAN